MPKEELSGVWEGPREMQTPRPSSTTSPWASPSRSAAAAPSASSSSGAEVMRLTPDPRNAWRSLQGW